MFLTIESSSIKLKLCRGLCFSGWRVRPLIRAAKVDFGTSYVCIACRIDILQAVWIVSRLEITLEQSQNNCEPSHIATHQDCPSLRWLQLSPHSQLLTLSFQHAYYSTRIGLLLFNALLFRLLSKLQQLTLHILGRNTYIPRPFDHPS